MKRRAVTGLYPKIQPKYLPLLEEFMDCVERKMLHTETTNLRVCLYVGMVPVADCRFIILDLIHHRNLTEYVKPSESYQKVRNSWE